MAALPPSPPSGNPKPPYDAAEAEWGQWRLTGRRLGYVFAMLAFAVCALWLFKVGLDRLTQKETSPKSIAIQRLAGSLKTALFAYAEDHEGRYPDSPESTAVQPRSANQAFRILFQGGYLDNERDFAIPDGAAEADGDISRAEQILSKGENHYALAKGLTLYSHAICPLVWEAPLAGHWDPTWDSSRKRSEWGSTWSDGSVLVMTVGGSVSTMKIDSRASGKKGPGRLAPMEEGKNLFQLQSNGGSLGPEW